MSAVKDYPPYLDYPKPKKPQTNADRIRAMSDEELAAHFGGRGLCSYIQDETDFCESRAVCRGCITDWLRQPVKDGEDE